MSARDLTLEPLPVFRAYRFLHSCRQILLGALADVQIGRPGVKLASRPLLNSPDCGDFVAPGGPQWAPTRRGRNRDGFRFWMKPPRTPWKGLQWGFRRISE